MLSNQDIIAAVKEGELDITPWNEELLNPNSYDLTLGSTFRRVRKTSLILDLCEFTEDYSVEEVMQTHPGIRNSNVQTMTVMPGECILAISEQAIYLSKHIGAEISSKSSMGRLFQTIHAGGAGFCDAGFQGHITLEIVNFMPRPVIYHAGMRVANISFHRLDNFAEPMYNAKGQYSNADNAPIPAKRIKKG